MPVAAAPVEVGSAVALPPPRLCTICGEWERQSEPYKGMRMEIGTSGTNAVVTRSASVPSPHAKDKAQLECQRSLWKPGDVLITQDGSKATIVVRDWGLTGGVCRHRDTKAPVDFIFEDEDNLLLSVTRGKTMVNQEWSRVR